MKDRGTGTKVSFIKGVDCTKTTMWNHSEMLALPSQFGS